MYSYIKKPVRRNVIFDILNDIHAHTDFDEPKLELEKEKTVAKQTSPKKTSPKKTSPKKTSPKKTTKSKK